MYITDSIPNASQNVSKSTRRRTQSKKIKENAKKRYTPRFKFKVIETKPSLEPQSELEQEEQSIDVSKHDFTLF